MFIAFPIHRRVALHAVAVQNRHGSCRAVILIVGIILVELAVVSALGMDCLFDDEPMLVIFIRNPFNQLSIGIVHSPLGKLPVLGGRLCLFVRRRLHLLGCLRRFLFPNILGCERFRFRRRAWLRMRQQPVKKAGKEADTDQRGKAEKRGDYNNACPVFGLRLIRSHRRAAVIAELCPLAHFFSAVCTVHRLTPLFCF